MVMPLQAPRGMKMGSLPGATLFPCLSGRMGPQGLVLRSCRIGATSSCRNWTRIPLGTEHCRSLLPGSHARKGVSLETGILPALPHWRCTMDVLYTHCAGLDVHKKPHSTRFSGKGYPHSA